jgi:hypothetical protein
MAYRQWNDKDFGKVYLNRDRGFYPNRAKIKSV